MKRKSKKVYPEPLDKTTEVKTESNSVKIVHRIKTIGVEGAKVGAKVSVISGRTVVKLSAKGGRAVAKGGVSLYNWFKRNISYHFKKSKISELPKYILKPGPGKNILRKVHVPPLSQADAKDKSKIEAKLGQAISHTELEEEGDALTILNFDDFFEHMPDEKTNDSHE